jgi:acetyl esterase/lipase
VAEDVSRAYLGQDYRAPKPETALADPLLVMESNASAVRPLPAFYAMAGTADILVEDTRRLENALNRRGVRNEVRYFPKEGHAFHLIGIGAGSNEFWRDHLIFLNREMARQRVFLKN